MADISRVTFDKTKAYTGVRSQQGRACLDADQNEQVDIDLHEQRRGRQLIIGEHGGPAGEAGFEITVVGEEQAQDLLLGAGSYFVDGVRVELGEGHSYLDQPYLLDAALPSADGTYVAYLDVWEREVTAIQDPEIREVALGGPDTTTRTQLVWQARLLRVGGVGLSPTCDDTFAAWTRLVDGPKGKLEVRLAPPGEDHDPCVVPEQAGYRGLENQCYRVQIHDGDFSPASVGGVDAGATPTFKWSRDNASTVATWRGHPEPLVLELDRLGPGGTNGLDIDDWLELTNDEDDLCERPGRFASVASLLGDTVTLDDPGGLAAALSPVPKSSAALHSQARRWDSPGAIPTSPSLAEADLTDDGWIRLGQDGVEIRFVGQGFRSGSSWTFPVRTAALPGTDEQLGWPPPGLDDSAVVAQAPDHRYARLALMQRIDGVWRRVADCRETFPQLTELTQLAILGGDGQHARSRHWLPAPIRVGVSRGSVPVADARVRFELLSSGGGMSLAKPNPSGSTSGTPTPIEAKSDAHGVVELWWRLGDGPSSEAPGDRFLAAAAQQLRVTLLAPGGASVHQQLHFVAHALDNLTLTVAGGDAQIGKPGETLEIALRVRVNDGTRPVPGAHVEFVNENRKFEGETLDQYSGGSLHASDVSTRVSFERWPGGQRMVSAVVATDAEGVAQIQWILGTDRRLSPQRVTAWLLGPDGQRTSQFHLFSAQLAIAQDIAWAPCKQLAPLVVGRHDVQGGLDAICQVLADIKSLQIEILARLERLETGGGDGTRSGDELLAPLVELQPRLRLDDLKALSKVIASIDFGPSDDDS